jgi:cytochrome c-type protein NapB
MKNILYFTFIICMLPQASFSEELEQEVQSLRGFNAIDDISEVPTWKRLPKDHDPIERNYIHQPPMIPHKVESYKITRRYNKCLTCHSWANYRSAGATKISATHFKDRDGNDLSNIAALRYFCTQCHVPQVDAKPLVENIFTPVDSIRSR